MNRREVLAKIMGVAALPIAMAIGCRSKDDKRPSPSYTPKVRGSGNQKLADILLSHPGGGAFDLIWGPELSSDFPVEVEDAIIEGLGIPPIISGPNWGHIPKLQEMNEASWYWNNWIELDEVFKAGAEAMKENTHETT